MQLSRQLVIRLLHKSLFKTIFKTYIGKIDFPNVSAKQTGRSDHIKNILLHTLNVETNG